MLLMEFSINERVLVKITGVNGWGFIISKSLIALVSTPGFYINSGSINLPTYFVSSFELNKVILGYEW